MWPRQRAARRCTGPRLPGPPFGEFTVGRRARRETPAGGTRRCGSPRAPQTRTPGAGPWAAGGEGAAPRGTRNPEPGSSASPFLIRHPTRSLLWTFFEKIFGKTDLCSRIGEPNQMSPCPGPSGHRQPASLPTPVPGAAEPIQSKNGPLQSAGP